LGRKPRSEERCMARVDKAKRSVMPAEIVLTLPKGGVKGSAGCQNGCRGLFV
jgi:hypothetical protein